MLSGNYSWAIPYLPNHVENIVEVGSRDALDAIELSNYFNCEVIAFEPDPRQFEVCEKNIEATGTQVCLRPEALTDSDGTICFWQVNPDLYPNVGASSLFVVNFDNRSDDDEDAFHRPIQEQIFVSGVRWDSLELKSPMLCVMDVEGAELKVLHGFGKRIKEVNYFVLEVAPVSTHVGGCNFREIRRFFRKHEFRYVASDISGNSYIALRFQLFLHSFRSRLRHPFAPARHRGLFNVCFQNKSFD